MDQLKDIHFSKTFRSLHNTFDLNREDAFYITARAYRGGGFTKDYLYLTGLKKIYNHYKQGKDLGNLLTGKVTLEYAHQIEYLIQQGYAVPSKYLTDSYNKNNNTNETINFILDNLKQ